MIVRLPFSTSKFVLDSREILAGVLGARHTGLSSLLWFEPMPQRVSPGPVPFCAPGAIFANPFFSPWSYDEFSDERRRRSNARDHTMSFGQQSRHGDDRPLLSLFLRFFVLCFFREEISWAGIETFFFVGIFSTRIRDRLW